MATLTGEQIKDEFLSLLSDSYGYWTDKENAQDAVPYINGAFDMMNYCLHKLERAKDSDETRGK